MQISSESKSLIELLPVTGNVGYIIPEYQRNYSWKEEQIEQLFNDILREDSGYYVGNLLVTSNTDSVDACDIIDGQQRLTTLSLFLLAIWERLNKWSAELPEGATLSDDDQEIIYGLKRDIKRQLINSQTKKPRIRLLDPDREIYDDMVGVIEGKEKGRWGNRSLPKRYNFIYNLFADKDSFPTPQSINEYYQKLVNASTLKISVPDLSDAFTVFSSLNSKGLPLTLVDLLKGEFISASSRSGLDRDSAIEKWTSFASIFSDTEGDTNNTATTQFLLNNYDAFEGTERSSVTKGNALKKYQKIIPSHYREGEDYLQTLIVRGKVFATIAQIDGAKNDAADDINHMLQKLSCLESSQAYPLLLFLFCKTKQLQIENQLPDILDYLVKFYVRRNIALVPKSSNIRAQMLGMIRNIEDNGLTGTDVSNLILSKLREMSVSDEQFANSILNEGMYDKNTKTTRFLLIDLERNLPGDNMFNKGTPDNLDEYIKKNQPRWTIEHILPEGSLPDYWKDAISPDDRTQANRVQQQYVHLIGNLTLSPYNADLQQLPFVDSKQPLEGDASNYKKSKRDFKENGNFVGLREPLRLNASIPDEGEAIEDKNNWTIEDINRRTEWFKDRILEMYSLPEERQDR